PQELLPEQAVVMIGWRLQTSAGIEEPPQQRFDGVRVQTAQPNARQVDPLLQHLLDGGNRHARMLHPRLHSGPAKQGPASAPRRRGPHAHGAVGPHAPAAKGNPFVFEQRRLPARLIEAHTILTGGPDHTNDLPLSLKCGQLWLNGGITNEKELAGALFWQPQQQAVDRRGYGLPAFLGRALQTD